MNISIRDFEYGSPIPPRFTCDGADVSPAVSILSVPEKTESLALVVDDPDSPTGIWTHWTLWNIPPETTVIEEGAIPPGAVSGTNTFGKRGYGGPCPHKGNHRYFFKLYALDRTLDIPENASAEVLTAAMTGHIIADAEYMGRYERAQTQII